MKEIHEVGSDIPCLPVEYSSTEFSLSSQLLSVSPTSQTFSSPTLASSQTAYVSPPISFSLTHQFSFCCDSGTFADTHVPGKLAGYASLARIGSSTRYLSFVDVWCRHGNCDTSSRRRPFDAGHFVSPRRAMKFVRFLYSRFVVYVIMLPAVK